MAFTNKAQLISYPDSLGGNLSGLRDAVSRFFPGCFPGGIHVLPPFPSTGDRGFAPVTYSDIDPRFGSWRDIKLLGEMGPVMLDLMVNHVSRQSAVFRDFLARGRASPYADLFLDVSRVWPGGNPDAADLAGIFLRRPVPYSDYRLATGETARMWTTFGHDDPSEQVDIDLEGPSGMRMCIDTLAMLREHGVGMVRLDAVGYVIKRRGTSCFFVEPEIWGVMDRLRDAARKLGMDLLPEVHAPIGIQRKLSDHGYWGYDFALPFIVLDAVMRGRSGLIGRYLRDRPPRLFTMLDCHDGIPVKPDLDGLVDEDDAVKTVDACVERGANLSRVSAGARRSASGFDVHQIRCTYYSALGRDDDAYIAARVLQLFTPGIPQIYYVGLLAGENDAERAVMSGDGREVNRHDYSMTEIARAAETPVVKRLTRLIRMRNECPAFSGRFSVLVPGPSAIELRWENGASIAACALDLSAMTAVVTQRDHKGGQSRWKA